MSSSTGTSRTNDRNTNTGTGQEEYTIILQLTYYPISPTDSETSVLDASQEWPDEPPAVNGKAATSDFDVDKVITTVTITLSDWSAARIMGLHSVRPDRQIYTVKFIDVGGLALIDPYRMNEERAKMRWNDHIESVVLNTRRVEQSIRGVEILEEDEEQDGFGREMDEEDVEEESTDVEEGDSEHFATWGDHEEACTGTRAAKAENEYELI